MNLFANATPILSVNNIDNLLFKPHHISSQHCFNKPTTLAYSDSQSLLAVSFNNTEVTILANSFKTILNSPQNINCNIKNLAFKERYLYAITGTHVIIWDLIKKDISSLTNFHSEITAIHLILNSTWLMVAVGGLIHLLDVSSGTRSSYSIQNTSGTPDNEIVSMQIKPADQNILLVAYKNGCVVLWDIEQRKIESCFQSTGLNCVGACWNPNGNDFVVAYGDGSLFFMVIKSKGFFNTKASTKYSFTMNINKELNAEQGISTKIQWQLVDKVATIIIQSFKSLILLKLTNSYKINELYSIESQGVIDFTLIPSSKEQNAHLLYIDSNSFVCHDLATRKNVLLSATAGFFNHFNHVCLSQSTTETIDQLQKSFINNESLDLIGGKVINSNSLKISNLIIKSYETFIEFYSFTLTIPDLIFKLNVNDQLKNEITSVFYNEIERSLIVSTVSQVLLYSLEPVTSINSRIAQKMKMTLKIYLIN
jgi:hypothetical protein